MSNWYWSNEEDGCHFHGPHESKEEAIAEAKSESTEEDEIFIGIGESVSVHINADAVIDQWANGDGVDLLYESALDYWCHKVPKEKLDALSAELTQVFEKHLHEWGEESSWNVIRDAVKVKP